MTLKIFLTVVLRDLRDMVTITRFLYVRLFFQGGLRIFNHTSSFHHYINKKNTIIRKIELFSFYVTT
jgi:hypothetical protein